MLNYSSDLWSWHVADFRGFGLIYWLVFICWAWFLFILLVGINPSVGIWCYDLHHQWASIRSSRSRRTENPRSSSLMTVDANPPQAGMTCCGFTWIFPFSARTKSGYQSFWWFNYFEIIYKVVWLIWKKIYLLSYFLVVKKQVTFLC